MDRGPEASAGQQASARAPTVQARKKADDSGTGAHYDTRCHMLYIILMAMRILWLAWRLDCSMYWEPIMSVEGLLGADTDEDGDFIAKARQAAAQEKLNATSAPTVIGKKRGAGSGMIAS